MTGEQMLAGAAPASDPEPSARSALTLHSVSYRHGTWHDIDTLAESEAAPRKALEDLRRGGLRRFSVLSGSLRNDYIECAGETLKKGGIDPADVDAVVHFSTSFSEADQDDIPELCRSLGMRNALPLGTFLGECTNFSSAILVASSLISSLGLHTVVLLGADAIGESQTRRLLDRNVSVFSDAIVSCVLQAGGAKEGYLVEKLSHRFDSELVGLDADADLITLIDLFAKAMGHVCDDVYASTGHGPEEFDHLVLPNLSISALKNYAAIARIPFARVETDNIGRFGHCFAYDQIIKLDTLAVDGAVSHDEKLLVVGAGGNYLFSAMALRRHSPQAGFIGGST